MPVQTLKQKQQAQDKERQAYAFFTSKGWKPHQAIGIVGNLKHESNLNTTVLGTADNKGSRAIAQWHGDRLKTLKSKYGDKWTDFNNQLEFVDWELRNTHKAAGDKLRNSKGVWEAGMVVSDYYERPKVKFNADDKRQAAVSDLAIKFKGIKLTPEDMPYYGATYANSVAPYMNPQYESQQSTSDVNYFNIPQKGTTFASVPTPEEEKKNQTEEDYATSAEAERVEKESNFLKEIEKLQNQDYAHLEPQKTVEQEEVQPVDYLQKYDEISQFIDEPIMGEQQNFQQQTAQQGLTWQEKLANRPKKLTVAELIAENNARQPQQDGVQRDATSVVQPKLPKKLTKEQALKVQKDLYENPFKPEGISSGDKTVDFLYNNDWLMDVPVIGGYIKDKAKEVAKKSGGNPYFFSDEHLEETLENDVNYSGRISDVDYNEVKIISDTNLLNQYFSEEPLYKKSKYKATSDYLDFLPSYSVKGDFKGSGFKSVLDYVVGDEKKYKDFVSNKKPIYKTEDANSRLSDLLDLNLGGHKIGASWDKERNLPYVSLSDAWDFEPKHYSKKWTTGIDDKNELNKAYIQSYLMHKAGNPFKVYDRFYFDPKTKEYIPDSPQRYQQGGEKQQNYAQQAIIKKLFQLQDERNLVQRDNTPTFKKQDKIRLLTEAEKEARRIAEIKARQGEIRQHTPQSTFSRVKEIGLNPLTAAGYAARNEDLPQNFSKGARNPLDYAIDVINPVQYVEDTKNVLQGTARGDLGQVGEGLLGVAPLGLEAKNIYKGVDRLGSRYLPNAYKYNPKAITHESFNNSNSFYRQIDTPTFNEGVESGLIKGKQSVNKTQGENIINLNKSFGDDAYYFKGKLYSPQRADYIYEVNKGEEFFKPRVNNKDYLKKGVPYTIENTNVRVSKTPIPLEEATIYKKDWLQGYKQVEGPKTAQNFKSEINWGNWNKEIPDNPQLMQEYNAIEQTSKANGSWMKNPDGSKFQGTPEQFIQQNSENFKKAFSGKVNKQYHTTDKNFEVFDTTKSPSKGIFFTPDKEYSEKFTKIYKPSDEVSNTGEYYLNVNKPLNVDDPISHTTVSHYYNQRPFAAGNYDAIQGKEMDILGGKSDIDVTTVFSPNQVKSAVGNNGMFDMTNPNIYKSVAPIAGASYLATQGHKDLSTKQQGGTAEEKDMQWLQDWYANRVIPNKEVNAEYQKVKGEYEDVSHAIPYPTYTGHIPLPENFKDGRIEGVRTKENEIKLVSPPNKTTYLHEADHFIDQNLLNTPMQDIHKSIIEQNIAPKEILKSRNAIDNYDYLRQPTEVHARLQELRKEAGFKPTQEIKEKDLDTFFKEYKGSIPGINDLFETFDKPHLIEILNSMAYNPKKGNSNVAQQGGKQKYTENELAFLSEIAIKDNDGQWTNPGKITEINSNQITMQGVDYPLLGISKETGETKKMFPNKEYKFGKKTKNIIELPLFKK